MRIRNCADCEKRVGRGEILFVVHWSLPEDKEKLVQLNFICQECMKGYMRESLVPGGRI